MRIRSLILTLIFLFFGAGSVSAISPPAQISPTDNSQVSSSKLTWETPSYSLYSKNPYRIQVDDNADFSSVYRNYDTKNTYYTPILTEGTWYWRIKVKDSDGNWSDWSDSWSFILAAATPSPTPSATPTPSPTANPTPAPTPAPTTSSGSKTKTTTPKTPAPTINTPAPSVQEIVVVSSPAKPSAKIEYRIASVAAAVATATPATKIAVKSQKQTNLFFWAGLILIFAGIFLLGYIIFRKNANPYIKLRKRY